MVSKKGFISIFWIAVMMLVTTAVMVTTTNIFSNYAGTPRAMIENPFQGHYNVEFGLMCGKKVLDTTLGAAHFITGQRRVYRMNTETVEVTITKVLGGNDYDIVSTEIGVVGRPPVSMQARYDAAQRILTRIN